MSPILVIILVALNFTQLSGLPFLSTTSQSGRFLAETVNLSDSSGHLDDTVRVDPLNNLKKYREGYDITNKHYWSSTAFTGIHGYAIAVLWILCGLGYGGYILVTRTCMSSRRSKRRSHCQKQCYAQPLLLAIILFTILAITASGLVLGGNERFHSRAKAVIDIVIRTVDEASNMIYNTTGAMKDMSSNLADVNAISQANAFLRSTSRRLDAHAANIARQANRNRHRIDLGLRIVYIITTVTISLTLVAVIALLLLGLLKFKRTLHVLIAICWILTVLGWLFFGVYFFLQNFAGDTCTALESFQQDPYNNSLSSILPCDELLSARTVLSDVRAGVYNLVNEVNTNISTSYGNIVQICNPFSAPPFHEYQPWNCPASSIRIGDIPQVLRQLTCPDSEGATCNGGILISANNYNTIEAYAASIQKLMDVYPGMESLVECKTIKDAFSEILRNHCRPLKRYVRMVWAALVLLSAVMVALVLMWAVRAHHNGYHYSLGVSVIRPHSATPDVLESGTAKPTNDKSKPSYYLQTIQDAVIFLKRL